jgi:hypothetical protein
VQFAGREAGTSSSRNSRVRLRFTPVSAPQVITAAPAAKTIAIGISRSVLQEVADRLGKFSGRKNQVAA